MRFVWRLRKKQKFIDSTHQFTYNEVIDGETNWIFSKWSSASRKRFEVNKVILWIENMFLKLKRWGTRAICLIQMDLIKILLVDSKHTSQSHTGNELKESNTQKKRTTKNINYHKKEAINLGLRWILNLITGYLCC